MSEKDNIAKEDLAADSQPPLTGSGTSQNIETPAVDVDTDTAIKSWVDEIAEEFKTIPRKTQAGYLVIKLAPSKDKTELDNLMATLIMTSYIAEDGSTVKTITVEKDDEGQFIVDFPNGKKGLKTTMFSGKYEFRFPKGDRWFTVTQEKFEETYFISKILPKIAGSDKFTTEEIRDHYADYLSDLFNYKLSKEFGIGDEQVRVGMVSSFIRTYTPPNKEKEEKYGNTRTSKWDAEAGEKGERLSGAYTELDFEVVEAIIAAYDTDNKPDDLPF